MARFVWLDGYLGQPVVRGYRVRSYLAICSLLLTRCTTNLHTAKYTRPSFRCPAQMYRPFALVAKLVHSSAYGGSSRGRDRPRSYAKTSRFPASISRRRLSRHVCIARKSYSCPCVACYYRYACPFGNSADFINSAQLDDREICVIVYERRQERCLDVAKCNTRIRKRMNLFVIKIGSRTMIYHAPVIIMQIK